MVADFSRRTRRFPPPWSAEELDACFVVRDHGGQKLAYVYFEEEPGRRSVVLLFYFLLLFDGPGWGAVTHFVVGLGAWGAVTHFVVGTGA
jgi:hypothetical protein